MVSGSRPFGTERIFSLGKKLTGLKTFTHSAPSRSVLSSSSFVVYISFEPSFKVFVIVGIRLSGRDTFLRASSMLVPATGFTRIVRVWALKTVGGFAYHVEKVVGVLLCIFYGWKKFPKSINLGSFCIA